MTYIPSEPVAAYEAKDREETVVKRIMGIFAENEFTTLECRGCLQVVNDAIDHYSVIRKPEN